MIETGIASRKSISNGWRLISPSASRVALDFSPSAGGVCGSMKQNSPMITPRNADSLNLGFVGFCRLETGLNAVVSGLLGSDGGVDLEDDLFDLVFEGGDGLGVSQSGLAQCGLPLAVADGQLQIERDRVIEEIRLGHLIERGVGVGTQPVGPVLENQVEAGQGLIS